MTGSAAWSGNALGLLNALEGIAYIVDTEGQVVAVGAQAWNEAAEWGGASSDISAEAVIGTNLFDAVSGGPVRAIARRIHEYVCTGDQCRVVYECLCYANSVELTVLNAVRPILDGNRVGSVLYQAITMANHLRPDISYIAEAEMLEPEQSHECQNWLHLCSYCARVAEPVASKSKGLEWLTGSEHYQRFGASQVKVLYGVCSACSTRLDNLLVGPEPPSRLLLH